LANSQSNKEVIAMSLSGDVRQLSQHLLKSHNTRLATVATIRAQTTQDLDEMRSARQSMASEQRRRLEEYRRQLAEHVTKMQDEVQTWRDDVQADLQSTSAQQRQRLEEGRSQLAKEGDAWLKGVQAARQSMAAQQRRRLDAQNTALRQKTTAFLEEMTAEHGSTVAKQRRNLDEYMTGLRSEMAVLLGELESGRQFNATRQRQWLSEEMRNLAAERTRMASAVAGRRGELLKDRVEAIRVWSSFGKLKQQRRHTRKPTLGATGQDESTHPVARGEILPAVPAPTQEVETVAWDATTSYPAPPDVDDLTVIRGIGPQVQSRLNNEGIFSYVQLAGSTAEDLRDLLGSVAGRANLENWIHDARKLAGWPDE
jgi:predicted flap endonuclease-1-like 5' DNA nuclease